MKRVSNYKVKVPIVAGGRPQSKKFIGRKLFLEPYSNIYLCARKRSGKTNIIWNILDQCADDRTTVLIFSATYHKDKAWGAIFKLLKKKKINYKAFDHFLDLENNSNRITDFISALQEVEEEKNNPASEIEKKKVDDGYCGCLYMGKDASEEPEEPIKKKKKRKRKTIAPKYILVFDDLSDELRNKSIATLMKSNRHWEMMTITSSQYLNDLAPAAIRNLDYVLLFRGLDENKLAELYTRLRPAVTLERLAEMYELATKKQYNFLYIDAAVEEYRINFNHKFT